MDSIEDPGILGEEVCVELEGRSDPVLCANHNGRCIQIVEAQLGNGLCHVVEEGASCAGIRNQNHLTGLTDGLQDLGVVQGGTESGC